VSQGRQKIGIWTEKEKVIDSISMSTQLAKKYYRVDEVDRYFSVCDRTIYRLVDKGEIRAIRLSDCIRIPAEEIRALEERLMEDFFENPGRCNKKG
jgi:excisionase family DNA binding protein